MVWQKASVFSGQFFLSALSDGGELLNYTVNQVELKVVASHNVWEELPRVKSVQQGESEHLFVEHEVDFFLDSTLSQSLLGQVVPVAQVLEIK